MLLEEHKLKERLAKMTLTQLQSETEIEKIADEIYAIKDNKTEKI